MPFETQREDWLAFIENFDSVLIIAAYTPFLGNFEDKIPKLEKLGIYEVGCSSCDKRKAPC